MKTRKREPAVVGQAWLAIIQAACPRGVVDLPLDPEVTYFAKLYPRLCSALAKIKGATVLYERDWSGESGDSQLKPGLFSFDDDDDDDDWERNWPDAGLGTSFSYHLFFVGLSDPAMQVACESECETDDQGTLETVAGNETLGYLVGVSLLAPVAIVQPDCYACFEDGSASYPDLRDEWYEAINPVFGPGEDLAGLDEGTAKALKQMRASVARVLMSARLKELPSELARARVPGLRAGSDAFVGKRHTGHSMTVQDAFFFAGP